MQEVKTTEIDKALLPDFLIIGAGKSGTTSLDNYLKQHPEVFMSEVKEPNFFAYDEFDLTDAYPELLQHYQESVTNIDEYLELFKAAQPTQKKGETSNTYMSIHSTAKTIYKYSPDIKLIAILRQPTERLYSRHLHLARVNKMVSDSFEDVLDKSSNWWVRNDLVKEGFYYKNLKPYFDTFPKENIKVFLSEDLRKDPQSLVDEIFEFIGVTPKSLDFSVTFNKSGFIKNKALDKIVGERSVVIGSIKKILPTSLFRKAKNSVFLQKLVNGARNKNLEQPKLSPELKERINQEIYKEDIIKLAKLINRDLSHWLK